MGNISAIIVVCSVCGALILILAIAFKIVSKKSSNNKLDDEINKWIDTGNAMDKAGAYGIQNEFCVFVEKIEGNYTTAIGLPTHKLYDIIKKCENFKNGKDLIKHAKKNKNYLYIRTSSRCTRNDGRINQSRNECCKI